MNEVELEEVEGIGQGESDPETKELWLAPGEPWFRDYEKFCDAYDVLCLQMDYDGVIFALVQDKGWIEVGHLVEGDKTASVHMINSIKG